MTFLKRIKTSAWLLSAALLCCVALPMQAQDLDTVRVEASTITLRAAMENGFFEKYRIKVVNSSSPNSDLMRAKLANGDVDIMDDGLDNAVALKLAGSDIVIVTGSSLADQELIGQPEIHSVRDLRGKTLIVDSSHTQAAVLLKKLLLKNGLRPGVDYRLKEVGTRRLPELRAHKDYAAAMMSGTTAIMAKKEGFVSLGTTARLIGRVLYSGSYTRRDWAVAHRDVLIRYIAAHIEAQRWLLNPANRAKVIHLITASGNPPAPEDAASAVYTKMMKGPTALTKNLQFDVAGFRKVLEVRAEVEHSWPGDKPPAPETFYDMSYLEKARAMVKSSR